MRKQVMYIELKTGYEDNGPAWIGKVEFSKSGRTVYFNDQAFHHAGKGHYSDIETKDNYWISGVKKNGEDRHWAGTGKIMIDKTIRNEYLQLVDFDVLDKNQFELVDIKPTNKQRFFELLNERIE